jgi:hypothetical protein
MRYKIIVFVIVLFFGGFIYSYSNYMSQRSEICERYVDLVRPQGGIWNPTPLQQSSFLLWENRYSLDVKKSLRLKELKGYKVLIAGDEFLPPILYHRENRVQATKRLDVFAFIYEEIVNSKFKTTTLWESYYSILQFSSKFSSLDCVNIEFGEWLKLTRFFDIFPLALPQGLQGVEILLDEEAKKMLVASAVETNGKILYDGAVISLEGDKIVYLIVSNENKEIVVASLVETAKVLRLK